MRPVLCCAALALLGCAKDEPAKPAPQVAPDAAPAPGLTLTAVDVAVTQDVTATLLIVVKPDGALAWIARPELGPLDLAALAPATDITRDELRATIFDRHQALLEQRAALTKATNCEDPNGGFGFGRSALGPGGGGTGWGGGDGTIGTGEGPKGSGYGMGGGGVGSGTIGREARPPIPAGLRGSAAGPDAACHNQTPLLLIDPRMPATKLVEVLGALDHAMIAVTAGGHVRTLALELGYLEGNLPAPPDPEERAVTVTAAGAQPPTDPVDGKWARVKLDGDVTADTLITALAGLLGAKVAGVAFGEPRNLQAPGFGTATSGGVARPRLETRVVLVPAKIVGTYDSYAVRRYLKRNLPKLRYCYEKQLRDQPKLEGTIALAFTIQPDGTTTAVTAKGVDEVVSSCVVEVVKTIAFPKPKDSTPAKVTQSIELAPTGGGG